MTCEALDWGLGKVSGLLLFLKPRIELIDNSIGGFYIWDSHVKN